MAMVIRGAGMAAERHTPLLPASGMREWGLGFAMAVIAGLACLTLLFAHAADRAEDMWRTQLSAHVTVIASVRDGQSFEAVAAAAADQIITVPGVFSAKPLTRQRAQELLQPWLGDRLPADMPLPAMVEVETDPAAPPGTDAIAASLKQAGIAAEVDGHAGWRDSLARMAAGVRLAGWISFAGLAAAAGALAAFAALSGLEAKRELVDILHQIGAHDRDIAQLFERRYGGLVLKSASIGAICALGLAIGLALLGGQDEYAPRLQLTLSDLARMVGVPLGLAGIAWLSARIAVLRAVQRMS